MRVLLRLCAMMAVCTHAQPSSLEVVRAGDPQLRCIERANGTTTGHNAYVVMIGPISATGEKKYVKWLYAVVALRRALLDAGSRADMLVVAALDDLEPRARLEPSHEAMLATQGVRFRYVLAPLGIRGFHMGHFKLWAWQLTEYDRVQVLDADVLPLVDMDSLFDVAPFTDFLGCPGKVSVLNAGWFTLRPSCEHFERLTRLLYDRGQRPGHPWSDRDGWGIGTMPRWRNAVGELMKSGWNFFDARGNQGHMYAYFRFIAKDLTLIYGDRIVAYSPEHVSEPLTVATKHDRGALSDTIYAAYPCPFPIQKGEGGLAYYHFTGNKKPWTSYQPQNKRFAQWYAKLAGLGIDVRSLIDM